MAKTFQVTLALLKPDIAGNPRLVQSIEKLILSRNFYIVKRRQERWTRPKAELFYFQHKDRFFYERLVGFMSSGPVCGLILAKENAIHEWRSLMGPTKVYQARFTQPKTIRGQVGLTDTRNTVHGSDAPETAKQELAQVFADFDLEKWEQNEGRLFEQGFVTYDKRAGIHEPIYDPDFKHIKRITHNDIRKFDMGSPDAWSRYYSRQTELVDWFVDFDQLKDHIAELISINPEFRTVIDIGCGSSMLGPKLANAHPNLRVYCIDTSVECLQALAENCEGLNCTFAIGDARKNMPFHDKTVDLIIDKGTSDAVARCADGRSNVMMLFNEAKRVLQPNGTLLQVTTDPPETRIPLISGLDEHARVSFTKLPNLSNNLPVYMYKVHFFRDDLKMQSPITTNFTHKFPTDDDIIHF